MSKLNLIPQEILLKRRNKRKLLVTSFCIGVVVLVLLYFFVTFFANIFFLERDIALYQDKILRIQNQLGEEKDFQRELNDLRKREAIYLSLIKGKTYFSDLISKIEGQKSGDIVLTSIILKDTKNVGIVGFSSSLLSCSNYINKLKAIDKIKDIFLNHIRFDTSRNVYYFELNVILK
ncbi:MAG: PilN domain-containing protein [Thermovenabulum sp.]|uniref:PilN domain-containing protein n=1 Tax=Thermovenabulum sp. TaxID=3100335 RepID=UPI003C7B8001